MNLNRLIKLIVSIDIVFFYTINKRVGCVWVNIFWHDKYWYKPWPINTNWHIYIYICYQLSSDLIYMVSIEIKPYSTYFKLKMDRIRSYICYLILELVLKLILAYPFKHYYFVIHTNIFYIKFSITNKTFEAHQKAISIYVVASSWI